MNVTMSPLIGTVAPDLNSWFVALNVCPSGLHNS